MPGVADGHAVVAGVPHSVDVHIHLRRIEADLAIVVDVRDPVVVVIVVAEVALPVAVGIQLVRVRVDRAVVAKNLDNRLV